MLRVALVGYPNAGKSTLFQALTGKPVEQNIYPFTTIKPDTALFPLLDPLLDQIAASVKPKQVVSASFLLYDIPGLIEGASSGAGLGNQFLAEIRPAHFLIFVLRNFQREEVTSNLGINPRKEMELVKTELMLSDVELLQRAIEKRAKKASVEHRAKEELDLLVQAKEALEREKKIKALPDGIELLTTKPCCAVVNGEPAADLGLKTFTLDNKLLLELSEMDELKEEFPEYRAFQQTIFELQQFVLESLQQTVFYTITGGQEVRSYILKRSATFQEAAGKVHTDMQKGFVKAFVLPAHEFLSLGSLEEAKKQGRLKTASRDDPVIPRSIIHFEFR